jgi:hypothetical protein
VCHQIEVPAAKVRQGFFSIKPLEFLTSARFYRVPHNYLNQKLET